MSKKRSGFTRVDHYPYGRKLPQKNAKGRKVRAGVRSALSILAEGERAFSSASHIPQPLAHTRVFGVNPLEIAPELKQIVAEGRSKSGRRLRRDARILLSGVASFPYTAEEVSKDAALREEFNRWVDLLIKFLRKRWPLELRSVVIHWDEKYLHAHFYCVVRMEGNVAMLDDLHPGKRASHAASLDIKAGPVLMKVRRDAYIRALRDFQGDYYVDVGAPLGHARYGEKKPRIPYPAALALRSQEQELRRAWRDLNGAQHALVAERRQVENDQLLLAAEQRTADLRKLNDDRERSFLRQYREKLTKWMRWAADKEVEVPNELEALLKSPN